MTNEISFLFEREPSLATMYLSVKSKQLKMTLRKNLKHK